MRDNEMAPTQRRFNWQEMQVYWQIHSKRWSSIDYNLDPDGLSNVCFVGAPLWLNRYYAHSQTMVYQKLYSRLPAAGTGKRALEVGCGTGRWCRFLVERGWDTIGIDLQPELIQINRARYPNVKFYCTPVQDYRAEEPFDLISAVTVVQHIPFDEQEVVFRKLRNMIRTGGHMIMLDSIYYQTPHVFSHTVKEWQTRVEKVGFSCIATQRYDYTPFLRLSSKTMALLSMLILRRRPVIDMPPTPETLDDAPPVYVSGGGHRNFFGWLGTVINIILGATTPVILGDNRLPGLSSRLDAIVEPVLVRANIPFYARHCGFLFRAI